MLLKQLYKIEVASGLEYESIAECSLGLKLNDKVVVQCERYLDFAKVSKICGDPSPLFRPWPCSELSATCSIENFV